MSSAGQRYAFIDLDDTLIDVNSGWLWAKHEWALGRITLVRESAQRGLQNCSAETRHSDACSVVLTPSQWNLVQAVYYMLTYALGMVENLEAAIESATSTYAGVPESLLATQTASWFAEVVEPRTRPGARAMLARHAAAGDVCVLASSTTQFAAASAVKAYGLAGAVSSSLDVDPATGLLTGRVAKLAFGKHKALRVQEWAAEHGVDLKLATFYSDSYADRTLLSQVGTPVVVNPDRRLRALAKARGWPIENWGSSPEPLRLHR